MTKQLLHPSSQLDYQLPNSDPLIFFICCSLLVTAWSTLWFGFVLVRKMKTETKTVSVLCVLVQKTKNRVSQCSRQREEEQDWKWYCCLDCLCCLCLAKCRHMQRIPSTVHCTANGVSCAMQAYHQVLLITLSCRLLSATATKTLLPPSGLQRICRCMHTYG